jgi:hypothetical protein
MLTAAMAVLLTVNIASLVNAGPLAGLPTTPFAFSGIVNGQTGQNAGAWQNSEVVQGGGFVSTGFEVTVEYAVFAPGSDFGDFLAAADPTGGTEWVYAFQVRLDGDNFGAGQESLLTGFDLGAAVNLIGSVAGTGDEATSAAFFNATSAQWDWPASTLTVGETSDVLYYTSPFAPKRDMVTVKAGFFADAGQSSTDGFASPVPEPVSILLIGTAGMLFLVRRRSF